MVDESSQRAGWLARLIGRSGDAPEWPPGTRIDRDVPYGRRPAHKLDIYRPAQGEHCPVLVVVHGGAWIMGDKANPGVVANKVVHWVTRGWVVISINYRLLPWGDPLEQASDVARALAAVQSRVSEWGGDPARVLLLGHSTGAHLGALVLADAAIGAPFGLARLAGGVLLDGAALDVVQVMQGVHLPLHDRAFGDDPEYWRRASPWHQLCAAPPPLLLICAEQRAESVVQAERFAARVAELGGSARVVTTALGHREINEQLGQPGALTDTVDAFLDPLGAAG